MRVEGTAVEPGAVLEADVCVVGAGPAGQTVAARLAARGREVLLLESGRAAPTPAHQALADAQRDPEGDWYTVGRANRVRAFGGMAHQWSIRLPDDPEPQVRLVELEPDDFDRRPWIAESGWPFGHAVLAPWYREAWRWLGLERVAGEQGSDGSDGSPTPWPLERGWRSRRFHFGRARRFLADGLAALEASTLVRLVWDATACELETSADGTRVDAVQVATLDGRRYRVRAREFVLAGGAVATTQLLLASDARHRDGLGNESGLLGQLLCDHPLVEVGWLIPAAPGLYARAGYYDLHDDRGAPAVGKLVLDAGVRAAAGLPGLAVALLPQTGGRVARLLRRLLPKGSHYGSAAVGAAGALARDLRRGRLDRSSWRALRLVLGSPADLLFQAERRLARPRTGDFGLDDPGWGPAIARGEVVPRAFRIVAMTEQTPTEGNRLRLARERDPLGCRQVESRWTWSERDRRGVAAACDSLQRALVAAGLGRVVLAQDHGDPRPLLLSLHHRSGTTRAHVSPRRGVVDADLRVHSVANAYVVSSSVFPTVGYANPTLTIVALALRLADHVAGR